MSAELQGHTIAISISDSPDLPALGLSELHLQDAMVELARHIFALGGRVAYGGDLRPGGFTRTLYALAESYDTEERVVEHYVAWPIHLVVSDADKEAVQSQRLERRHFMSIARLQELPAPADLVGEGRPIADEKVFLPPSDAQNLYVWARSLVAMRELMAKECAARIMLGGRVLGFKGRYPGLVEEALITMQAGRPLYLLAGFGGATRAVWDALRGDPPAELSAEAFGPEWQAMAAHFAAEAKAGRSPVDPPDVEAMLDWFAEQGVAGLARLNGLTVEENERLAQTPHLPEMLSLMLRGMAKVLE